MRLPASTHLRMVEFLEAANSPNGSGSLEDFTQALADVVFFCGLSSRPVYAHRLMIASASEPIFKMLTIGMMESSTRQVLLPDFEAETVLLALRCIYGAEPTFELSQVYPLYSFAHCYMVHALEKQLLEHVRQLTAVYMSGVELQTPSLTAELLNVYARATSSRLWKLADALYPAVSHRAVRGLCATSSPSTSLRLISIHTLQRLLSLNHLDIPELQLFHFVSSYINLNVLCDEDIHSLVSLLRLGSIPSRQLIEVVEPTGLVPPKALFNAYRHHACPEATRFADTAMICRGSPIPAVFPESQTEFTTACSPFAMSRAEPQVHIKICRLSVEPATWVGVLGMSDAADAKDMDQWLGVARAGFALSQSGFACHAEDDAYSNNPRGRFVPNMQNALRFGEGDIVTLSIDFDALALLCSVNGSHPVIVHEGLGPFLSEGVRFYPAVSGRYGMSAIIGHQHSTAVREDDEHEHDVSSTLEIAAAA